MKNERYSALPVVYCPAKNNVGGKLELQAVINAKSTQ